MKFIGYCPHCGSKITEVKVMGFFDDFTFKCWECKKICRVYEVNFKRLTKNKSGDIISIEKIKE